MNKNDKCIKCGKPPGYFVFRANVLVDVLHELQPNGEWECVKETVDSHRIDNKSVLIYCRKCWDTE